MEKSVGVYAIYIFTLTSEILFSVFHILLHWLAYVDNEGQDFVINIWFDMCGYTIY